ncbi:hypothetical protein D3C87_2035560 [compost metagenome]
MVLSAAVPVLTTKVWSANWMRSMPLAVPICSSWESSSSPFEASISSIVSVEPLKANE